jgi:hypothetical protein
MAQHLEQGSSLDKGVKEGLISESQRDKLPLGWRKWSEQSDALFAMTDIQVVCKR